MVCSGAAVETCGKSVCTVCRDTAKSFARATLSSKRPSNIQGPSLPTTPLPSSVVHETSMLSERFIKIIVCVCLRQRERGREEGEERDRENVGVYVERTTCWRSFSPPSIQVQGLNSGQQALWQVS